MMDKLISRLLEHGVYLSREGDKLKLEYNGASVSEELLQEIRTHKDDLLKYLSIESENADYQEIVPVAPAASYKLSSAQKRLWVLSQFEEGSVAYNMASSTTLSGVYNVENFKRAIMSAIDRHEILRTVFREDEAGEIRQWVLSLQDLGFVVDHKDFRKDPHQSRNLEAYMAIDTAKPFDLEKGPLLRAALLQTGDQDYTFYFNMHHIISDGRSMEVLAHDVFSYYEAYNENKEPAGLKNLRIQYKDYSAWQLEQLEGDEFRAHKTYWLDQLKGQLPVLDLPGSKQRPRIKTYNGYGLGTYLDSAITRTMRDYAQQNRGSLFMVLLSAWNVLMYRYTSQKDLIVGMAVQGRDHADLKDQIGFYINTLALRNEVRSEESFDELFARVKQNTFNAYSHQMYPFDSLLESLNLVRDASRSAVFDMLIGFNIDERVQQTNPGKEELAAILDVGPISVKYDLDFHFTERKDSVAIHVNFNQDVYEKHTIQKLIKQFKNLVSQLLANTGKAVGTVEFLSEEEKNTLLLQFNTTQADYPKDKTVTDLFAEQVKRTPAHVAIKHGAKSLTYKELDELSNQLAQCIRSNYGVRPNDLVGIKLDRTEWAVISMLGVMKAGAAYLPIDPEYPSSRKQHIVSESGISLLITETSYLFDEEVFEGSVFAIDVEFEKEKYSKEPLDVVIAPNSLAYVIYTSGSTGNPKGVMIEHASLTNYLTWALSVYPGESLRPLSFGLFTSLSFDLTVSSLYLPLISGGELSLFDPSSDMASVLKTYVESDIDSIKITPAHINLLKDLGVTQSNIRVAIVGGDRLEQKQVAILKRLNPAMRIYNEYGPTESTVGCIVKEIASEQEEILIGKPIANTRIYIVNEEGQLQPEGVIGELYIAGDGLARGYLNQDELTREKFISDPFRQNGRLYKTGDLGRWLPGGTIEFMGREDEQVKIRGYRIELGEIEHALNRHAGVEYSTVMTRENGEEGDKQLIAYVVPHEDTAFTVRRILKPGKLNTEFEAELYEMENGVSMYSYNKSEVKMLYTEVFSLRTYDKNGIVIPADACIMDVGANVGSFSLYAAVTFENPHIYSFEPLLPIYDLLKKNTSLYKADIKTFNIGISDKEEEVMFDYYPYATVLSGRYSEEYKIRDAVKKYIVNSQDSQEENLSEQEMEELLEDRLVSRKYKCKLKTLSQVIKENNISKIDLLKVDAENSEMHVLRGISEEDWDKIGQVILEVYNDDNRLEKVKELLSRHGFNVAVHQSDELDGTHFYDVYAIRPPQAAAESVRLVAGRNWYGTNAMAEDIRRSLRERLPDYMVPSEIILLDSIPLTANGKVDSKALAEFANTKLGSKIHLVAPRDEMEERVLKIWKDVLQKENIGVKDDFFALGGHSLKAVRLSNEYEKGLGVKLSLKDLFANATIELQAGLIRASQRTEFVRIEKTAQQESYPLSDAQRRLWILSQFDEASLAYNMPGRTDLNEAVDVLSFTKAISAIIERHEILRTVFKEDARGEIRQWILESEDLGFKIEHKDLRNEADAEEKVQAYIHEDAYRSFDLEKGPLLRAALLQVADKKYVFCYNMHHIISDGWSMEVLSKDVLAYYNAYKENKTPALKELTIQYKDYAAWQLSQLQGEAFEEHRAYWMKQLEGELPVLDLPASKKRPRLKTYNGYGLTTYLDAGTTSQLRAYSEAQGGSLFMALLATWNVLVYKYTSQRDSVTGTPVAGRNHADLEDQIGFYLNTLVFRNQLDPQQSFTSFYQQVKESALAAYSHQVYPFDRLVEELNLVRDTSRSPLFDILLDLHTTGEGIKADAASEGAADVVAALGSLLVKYDLELHFTEMGNRILMQVLFNEDVYERAAIETIIQHYKQLAAELVVQASQPLAAVSFLSADEKEELLTTFNNTHVAYPKNNTLIDLFEAQVKKQPEQIALKRSAKVWTYEALDALSNKLAHCLVTDYGIKEHDLVGIKLDRTEWAVISMLGVLKAGAAYLPIDPENPTSRRQQIVSGSGITLLITDTTYVFDEEEFEGPVFAIDVEFREEDHSAERINRIGSPANLAYVLYTSGSTGNPKGVMIEHGSLLNYLNWACAAYAPGKEEKLDLGLFTSLSFDLTVTSIYLPLISGGTLQLFEPSSEITSVLKSYLESDLSCIKLTPAHILLLKHLEIKASSVQVAIVGGDRLEKQQVEILRALNPGIRIFNEYGPTESTVGCMVKEIGAEETILIGKAIANTRVYLLNEAGGLVPKGGKGEICISGAGLARGYLHQEVLSQEKFITHPFRSGERLYKSGDLGRWLSDGNMEFLGRKDEQVKIRGYRIEPGEVEQALLTRSGVKEAVVLARENQDKEKVLVAYITASSEQSTVALRDHLKQILPEYMLPAYFVQLNKLPLNVNGKLDKKALPALEGMELANSPEYAPPANALEEQLVSIWQQILKKERIGVTDDFFAVGGHSLKALQLSNEYQKELGVKISLKELFAHTSVQAHASLITSYKDSEASYRYNRIPRAQQKAAYKLSSAQKRLYFLQKLSPESTSYNMPNCYFLSESLDRVKLEESFRKLMDRHEILRTYFVDEQGTVVQKIAQEAAFSIDQHACSDPGEISALLKNYIRAFDLSRAPLIRSVLVKLKNGYLWMTDMHHIISDGTSEQLLIKDLLAIYQGIELPALTLTYKDYAEWQHEQAGNGMLDKQQHYWREKLKGDLPVLNFPVDSPRPAAFTFRGAHYNFSLDKDTSARLRKMTEGSKGTLQISLMTVLNVLVFKYTGQQDLIIGCGISGRSHNELQGIAGMFVNMLAIRTAPSEEKTFSEFYKEVSATSLEAYDNQDVQFDDLVDDLKIQRDVSRNPVFDIALVVQNFDRTKIEANNPILKTAQGKEMPDTELWSKTSKFDLTFFAQERGEVVDLSIEYYSDLFEEATIKRIAGHFNRILDQVVANKDIPLSNVTLLSEEERIQVLEEFNDTRSPFPDQKNVHDLFTEQSLLSPAKIAVSDEAGSYTYSELDTRSGTLAAFLTKQLNIPAEAYVGILQSRNKELIASILGVIKAGGAYLNLDADLPEERLLYMLKDAKVNCLLTEKGLVGLASRLQWRGGIEHIVCVDSADIYAEHGGISNDLTRKDLWEYVGKRAVDAITAGGWLSSYTGNAISALEMDEYANNAYLKLKKLLHKKMKVLEIGCSSGLTMFRVAPEVGSYYGTDLSSSILERAGEEAARNGHKNIFLSCIPAHEIESIGEKEFDLIIINSVIQCFEDHNYLRKILLMATGLLKDKGYIFAGDIMDEDKREELIRDLEEFKQNDTANEYKTKTDWSSELFVPKSYFMDMLAENTGVSAIDFSEKIHTIANELTKFRYDALLTVEKGMEARVKARSRKQYDLRTIHEHAGSKVVSKVNPDNLCYLMYTSGSTGRPKGVMIEHRSVIRLVKNTNIYSFSSSDKVLSTGAISFDATTFEYWGPLLNGGELILCSQKSLIDTRLLGKIIKDKAVNLMWLTSGWLNQLVESDLPLFSGLETIIAGGDRLSPQHIEKLRKTYPRLRIINGYGPTENTTFSNTFEITQVSAAIPIGKPVSNSVSYIVDRNNLLLPPGVVGEICLGGAGLARGYLNQEELTREKFIPSPFRKGERLYKTGDLGRWNSNGSIEFIGRNDNQVKIRGYRVELGEIEHALQEHREIAQAVVLARVNKSNEKELVAYITSVSQQNSTDLRAYLKDSLPEYMLPSYFIQLPEMPLTSNGKIDKKQLPDPEGHGLGSGLEYVAPRNEQEVLLVKIWEKVLQRKNIGVTDDFFELGGHSLKAVRLSNTYEKELGVKIALRDLFVYTSVEAQAQLVNTARKEAFVEIPQVPRQESYAIADAQRRLWVLSQFEDASVAYNMPGSIRLDRGIDVESFERAIIATIERHEVLRTVFKMDEKGEVRQWIKTSRDLGFKVEHRDLRKEQDKEKKVRSYMHEDAGKAFDLEKGPLLRAALLQVGDQEYMFYFNMHHIISDGWSMDVLSKDVLAHYEAFTGNKRSLPEPLRIQYKDYSAWQLAQLNREAAGTHRAYWLEMLKGELPLLDLPGSKKRPEVKTHTGRTVVTYLDKASTGKLRNYAQAHEGSLFIGVVSVLKGLLFRYTGQQDLLIGMQVAGRDHADLADQIGFYVNALALRTTITAEDSFEQLYQKVHDRILEAYTHQAYPFDRLVEELDQNRLASRSAVFDVTVVFQNTGEKITELQVAEEKSDEITEFDRGTCIYDIKFGFQEQGEYLQLLVEYNTDVYEGEMIEGFLRHFKRFTGQLLALRGQAIGTIDYLTTEEKQKQLAAAHNKAAYPEDKTIVDLFQEQVKKHNKAQAVVYGDIQYSYEELNRRANQVAHFLRSEPGIEKEERVGLLLNPGLETIAAMLGILKAGGAYLPLDPSLPEERLRFMAKDSGMRVLITEKVFMETANRLQWGIENLDHYLCIDSDDVRSEPDKEENVMMSQELWDHVGERADDQITGGGWLSSYTGKAIPAEEMEEYAMNAYTKLQPGLHKKMRVLEIGCSSALTLSKVAPEVGFYYGTDLSPVIISNTEKLLREKGLKHVKLKQLVAHEISSLDEKDFDLIIINSVIQHFHGHNYLLKVIRDSIGLLKDKGRIFIGDVMDMNKKNDLIEDLEAFKSANTGKGYTTKTDFSSDLFVSRGYFEDLEIDENEIADVEISEKIRTIENELTKFRYDAVLHIDKKSAKGNVKRQVKHKFQYSRPHLDLQPQTAPKIKVTPDQLAYIIYTSGTTGKPKGVMIDHYNVVRLFKNDAALYDFSNNDVWTMFHSYAFDFSVWEMYGALFFGGKLVVVPKQTARDAGAFLSLLEKEGVTVLNQTPSAFYALSKETENLKADLKVRYVIFGGEALSPGKLQFWRTAYPECRLINMYGITETTVHTTYKEISQEDISLNRSNIGKAIPTVSCLVLDENKYLVPAGVAGELYVGGAGVARAYLNRDELTRERFIAHPFLKGERLYRSGDKVRLLFNGDMEYLGRVDDQVKIRGYRIELGEIEHALLKHDQVEEAVVLAKMDRSQENELVAYIRCGTQQNTNDLRIWLKALLPEYMLPSYFVQVVEMPLTRNGKIDKKALPDPEGAGMGSGVEYVAPENAIEKELVKIWEEVLQRKNIGIKDDFFALGGHSLKAMRLLAAYDKTFNIRLPLREIFEKTQIASHAQLIDIKTWVNKEPHKETSFQNENIETFNF